MRKVAIMTWYHYNNYGTVLQACALSAVIAKLGYAASVIKHVPQPPERPPLIQEMCSLEWVKRKAVDRFRRPLLEDAATRLEFDRFRDRHLVFTTACETSSELYQLNRSYDAFVCGSDQIWAPSLFDPKYYLDFVEGQDSIIAYSSSIGTTVISNTRIMREMEYYIRRFRFLSVRERQGQELLTRLWDLSSEVVLDPTLLLTVQEWDTFRQPYPVASGSYSLCYFLGNRRTDWISVQKLADELDLHIVVLPTNNKAPPANCAIASGAGVDYAR